MKSSNEQIQDAVTRFLSGEFENSSHAARETGVQRQTIEARLKGAKPHNQAHDTQLKVPRELEEELVQWILAEDRAGQAPGYARTRTMAEEMLEAAGLPSTVGENWHYAFRSRHPEIRAADARHVEASRINACNSETVLAFFEQLKAIKHEYKINDSHVWNMDESGIQMGDTGREKVFCDATANDSGPAIVKSPSLEKWITTLEAICASGDKIAPLLIFAAKNLWTTWFSRDLKAEEMKD
jgi:Tc5 transposase DNA-binding domain